MLENITILELLYRIKIYRNDIDSLYKLYIDPNVKESTRSLVSLYYTNTGISVNGIDKDNVVKDITNIDTDITETFQNLQKLLMIKEQINAECKLTVPSPFSDSEITLSIAQLLVLKSRSVSRYNKEYLDKLKFDYDYASAALKQYQETSMSADKINAYVLARVKSDKDSGKEGKTFSDYADEYTEANKLEILDPLNVHDTIQIRKKRMEKFYNSVDIKISEFNASTRIWIDLSKDEDFWGYC